MTQGKPGQFLKAASTDKRPSFSPGRDGWRIHMGDLAGSVPINADGQPWSAPLPSIAVIFPECNDAVIQWQLAYVEFRGPVARVPVAVSVDEIR